MSFDLDVIDVPVNLSDGVWVDDIPDHLGERYKVRSKNYRPYVVAHSRLLRSIGRDLAEIVHSDQYKKALGLLLAEHILIDWEGAVTSNGVDVPYSREVADKILSATDARGVGDGFRDVVFYASGMVADKLMSSTEELAKNSRKPSTGK